MKKFRDLADLRKNAKATAPPPPAMAKPPAPGQDGVSIGAASMPQILTENQYRNRRFEGVNMGSWFVDEQWICQSVFANAASPQLSDLDICKGSNAQTNLQNHWDSWITTSDWQFIVNQGLNTIRLPIGYYSCSQASLIADTDFGAYGTVFSGCWQRVLNAINTAASYGLGVLVDLHAAPGGQNNQPHSGTSSGVAGLWGNATNLARTQSTLEFLCQQLGNTENIVGIELLNEPQNGDYLEGWYVSTIQSLRNGYIANSFPLYIHDAYDPQYYASFVGSRTDLGYVVMDTHYYRCFSASDTAENSDDIIQDVINDTTGFWAGIKTASGGKAVCGEWSAALAPTSLDQSTRSPDSSRGYFAYVQLAMFKADIVGGWMFWTIKKESGTDTGWSLEDARAANTVPPDFSTYFVVPNAPSIPSATNAPVDKQQTMRSALTQFRQTLVDYPRLHGRPGMSPPVPEEGESNQIDDMPEAQSQLFLQGFEVGFNDAQTFAMGVPVIGGSNRAGSIGAIQPWKEMRTLQFLDAQDKAQTKNSNLWQKLLQFVKKAEPGKQESDGEKLGRAWEFMDGMEAGINAVQGESSQNTIKASANFEAWGKQMTDAFKNKTGSK